MARVRAVNGCAVLDYAIHGTAVHVERIVRDFRRCKEAEELSRDAQQQANRKVTWFHDEEGMLVIKARLPPEAGHIKHWAHGGETKLANLVSLCASIIDKCTKGTSSFSCSMTAQFAPSHLQDDPLIARCRITRSRSAIGIS